MESYVAKKHWWFWVGPCILSLILIFTVIAPIIILGFAFLRWKLDVIEVKDGCLYSRLGIIFIDKKTIPLEQISFVTEKTDILSQWLGFGTIQVQSSAFAKAIEYSCIEKPQNMIKYINEHKK